MEYSKTYWQDSPSTATPLSAANLNKIENGIEAAANAVTALETGKMDADDATVYHVDTTTQTLTYDNTNPKTIYLNARVSYGSVSNRAAVVISTSSKGYQFAITVTGDILMRSGGGTYPTVWTVLYGSSYKKNSINDDNKNSSVFIPTIGAVVSYLAANYIGNGSGTVTETNLATALKNSLYRVDNTTENVVYNADNPRIIYTNARVNGNKPTLVFTLGDDSQLAMYKDGHLYCRTYANGAYGSWIDLKATSIGESNKTSGAYPTVQAVYNFVTAFVASAIATKLDNAANAVKTMHITDDAVTEEKLSFQAREKLNSIDSESVREATAQYLAAHPDLSASLRFVTPEMYAGTDAETDAEKITAAIDSGLPVLLTGTYDVGDFTISRSCRIFGKKPENSKNDYNLIGNITFTMPAVLSDLTIKGSVTFDKVTDDKVSTQTSPTIVTNVSVRGNDGYPTHNGFVIRSSEGRYINCVAVNALHGFSVENIANRLVNCTSYFNMLDGFHVNQGTNMLLACKAFLNSRYNKYWLMHGGYDTESNPPRASYYGYYLGGKDIQCVGCSSQQNHRGSVYIGTDALVTDINILGDNTDYYDQDSTYGADIRNDSTDSAAFTFGPGVQGEKLAPRISGKVSLYREYRDGRDWSAYTPIVFRKRGSKSNIYIDANIFVPELAPDFNSEVSPTVLGDGMTGIENIVINGDALFNSLHGFSISTQSTNVLYSYDGNVLKTSNKSLVRNFTSTDFMSCKQVTVAVDFRSDLESSYCNVGVELSDGTRMSGISKDNTNQYSDVHTFIAPEGKTITGITVQGARHPDTDNWNEFWDCYRIKVSFEA